MCPPAATIEGQSLNITVLSYGENLEFGLTGCRRNVAHLQRLLGHLEYALAELEAGAARRDPTSQRSAKSARQRPYQKGMNQ